MATINVIGDKYIMRYSVYTDEKTIQYNHCDKRFDFYNQEIDGRFRYH